MQKSNEDCFYFITATCAKGSACSYRHNPTVLTCNVICPAWSRGNCPDPACPFRHSTIQPSVISNGIKCFYENTPMGCLKHDCTYIHTRSRLNPRNSPSPRPSTTNLVNKDVIKTSPVIDPTTPPTSTINEPVPTPPPPPKIETPPKVETPPVPEKLPTPPPIVTESADRNVVSEPSRVVVNRNVVISEPSRKVIQTTTSNRVVVSSKRPANDSDSDLDDLIEQENDTRKTNTVIDISFPCSAPSITNRLFTTSKPSTPTNDTKPIRLKRDILPATKVSAPKLISPPTNGEKISAGTGLSQDVDRRTSRIERFKKKPASSPPRTMVNNNSIQTRNVINSSPNERKRPASEQITNDSPPLKRLSSKQEHNSTTIGDLFSPPISPHRSHTRHHRRRRSSSSPSASSSSSPSPPPLRKSPLRQPYSATSTMNELAWKRQVDEFLAKTTQPKPQVIAKPVPLLSLRPRYVPPPVPQPLMPPQQSQPVRIKRPAPSVTTPTEVPTKPVEPAPPVPALQRNNSKDDDENHLLGLDEPTDVVDTFALIDEVLLETDDLFELT